MTIASELTLASELGIVAKSNGDRISTIVTKIVEKLA